MKCTLYIVKHYTNGIFTNLFISDSNNTVAKYTELVVCEEMLTTSSGEVCVMEREGERAHIESRAS